MQFVGSLPLTGWRETLAHARCDAAPGMPAGGCARCCSSPGSGWTLESPSGSPNHTTRFRPWDSCLSRKKQVDCAGSGHVGHRERAVAVAAAAATETEGSDCPAVPTAKRYGVWTFWKGPSRRPYTLRWAGPPPLARAWLVIPGTLGAFCVRSGLRASRYFSWAQLTIDRLWTVRHLFPPSAGRGPPCIAVQPQACVAGGEHSSGDVA